MAMPRITLNTRDSKNLPFVFHRTQFHIQLSFTMTVNKSQGQTFYNIGLYIDQDNATFGHDRLYAALSRWRSEHDTKAQIIGAKNDGKKVSVEILSLKKWCDFIYFSFLKIL